MGLKSLNPSKHVHHHLNSMFSILARKNIDVEEIDLKFLDQPMHSSTPTPSTDRTILAGHLDYTADDKIGTEDISPKFMPKSEN